MPSKESSTPPTSVPAGVARSARRRQAAGAWPIVLFMMFSFAGNGAFSPYLQLNFQERGLDSAQIGMLTGIGPALGIVMPLIWGVIGDRSRRVRLLLAVTSLAGAVAFLGMSLPLSFVALMVASAIYNFFCMGGGPLGSALVLAEAERLHSDYGSLRMWASVGFAVGILVAGRFVQGFGTVAIFSLYAVFVAASVVPLARVREAEFRGRGLDTAKVMAALRNRGLQALLTVSFLWRITSAAYYTFFTIYINDLGASSSLVSLAWVTGLAGEVTVLRLSGRIAKRIGVAGLLALGLGGSALRWAVYALIPSPEWAVPFQVLHGLTFGATTAATVTAIDGIFPTELRSTGQGLLSIVMWGLGGVVGSLLVGALADPLGYRGLFTASAVGAALTALLMMVVVRRGGLRFSSDGAGATR